MQCTGAPIPTWLTSTRGSSYRFVTVVAINNPVEGSSTSRSTSSERRQQAGRERERVAGMQRDLGSGNRPGPRAPHPARARHVSGAQGGAAAETRRRCRLEGRYMSRWQVRRGQAGDMGDALSSAPSRACGVLGHERETRQARDEIRVDGDAGDQEGLGCLSVCRAVVLDAAEGRQCLAGGSASGRRRAVCLWKKATRHMTRPDKTATADCGLNRVH